MGIFLMCMGILPVYPWNQKRALDSPGSGVKVVRHHKGAGNQTLSSGRAVSALNCWATLAIPSWWHHSLAAGPEMLILIKTKQTTKTTAKNKKVLQKHQHSTGNEVGRVWSDS